MYAMAGMLVLSHFITSAVVSLVGRDARVSVTMLRDTGAKHSFILRSVLPFSSVMEMGDNIVTRGKGDGIGSGAKV